MAKTRRPTRGLRPSTGPPDSTTPHQPCLDRLTDAELQRAVDTLPGAADAGLPLSRLADLATLADRLLRHGWTYDGAGQWNPPAAPTGTGTGEGPPNTRRTRRAGMRVQPGEQRRGGRERPGRPEGGP